MLSSLLYNLHLWDLLCNLHAAPVPFFSHSSGFFMSSFFTSLERKTHVPFLPNPLFLYAHFLVFYSEDSCALPSLFETPLTLRCLMFPPWKLDNLTHDQIQARLI